MYLKSTEHGLTDKAFLSVVLLIIFFLLIPIDSIAEKRLMRGRVVEYGGENGISKVTVEYKYSKDEIAPEDQKTTTDQNGEYGFKVPIHKYWIFIIYTPDNGDLEKYSTGSRAWVKNDANPKDLDTIGLSIIDQACSDERTALYAAWASYGYVHLGGNPELAKKFPAILRKNNCQSAFDAVKKDTQLVEFLKKFGGLNWLE